MIKYILTMVYVIFTTSGLYLMKLGGDNLSFSLKDGINFHLGYITFFGFLCYLISFLLWQKLLITFDLSYIVPIVTGITQIIILAIGIILFKEKINVMGIIGVILVIIGIVLMVFGRK